MKDNIALIGFMGSGKTTIGKLLSKSLDMKFIDTDRLISSIEKKSVNEIFAQKGQEYFRELERKVILQESSGNNVVISTGGGSILDNTNVKNLKRTCFVVYLNCDVDCLYERLKNSTTRPILNESPDRYKTIEELLNKRKFLYHISADCVINIDKNTHPMDTVEKIKEHYISS